MHCRSDLLPSPSKSLILKKCPVPQQLLLNYKINEILGNRGCFLRGNLLWLVFNKALTCLQPFTPQPLHQEGKARDDSVPVPADTTALWLWDSALSRAHQCTGAAAQLGQIPARSHFAQVTPEENTCPSS